MKGLQTTSPALGWLLMSLLAAPLAAAPLTLQGETQSYSIDPDTLAISVNKIPVSAGQPARQVDQLQQDEQQASWHWPAQDARVNVKLDGDDLLLTLVSDSPRQLAWYSLPKNQTHLSLAFGEGSRFSVRDSDWLGYVGDELAELNTHHDLKLPLWSQDAGKQTYSWILQTPYDNQLSFTRKGGRLQLSAQHEFSSVNRQAPMVVRLSVGDDWLAGARRYREWLQGEGAWQSLADKFARIPAGRRLIGASHVYLWGDALLDRQDVKDWPGLQATLRQQPAWQQGFSGEERAALAASAPEPWQQTLIMAGLNRLIASLLPLPAQQGPLSQSKVLALRQQWVKGQFGEQLVAQERWGQGLSLPVVEALQQAGLRKLWLGTPQWTAALQQGDALTAAQRLGYLVGSYDSYDTAIPPGSNDSWLTAQLPVEIGKRCAILEANGKPKPGFGGEGVYLNPGCTLPFAKSRMSELARTSGINSLFLDVDGTAMASNDDNPAHQQGSQSMIADRNARMSWVGERLGLVLGSEDGNALTSKPLIFAHGIQSWGFGWEDAAMRQQAKSPYYLGKWWPDEAPQLFFQPARLKPRYLKTVFNPADRLPLYQAVFHDAVLNSHHWLLDNLKFPGIKEERALLGLLYNTPPLVNLSRSTLDSRLPELVRLDSQFAPLHEALWDKALVGFRWRDGVGRVQETRFSDGSRLVANFSQSTMILDGHKLPGRQLLVALKGKPVTLLKM
ncbi:glycoside hydrolase [Aeromonas popoffii]|uniref:Glycoside hydrolase n=1 Tax=Aeromonas popoffii TaxID=70856 RepID=A0ABS5GQ68_9GAMM|nr:glycoside hydrolase [Aeromonas popoffii]MBR7629266.1 glycoside hydrolase [Aeromonas popoffii]